MLGPPNVKRKFVSRGKRERLFKFVLVNRTVLVLALRFVTLVVKLVRLLAGGE
jgi:hypothetical protein